MWTFPVILFLSFVTFFPTAWIVRAISHGFWQWSVTHAHILIAMRTVPEIENAVYVSSLGIGVCLFFIFFQFTKYLLSYRWFERVVIAVNYTFALYLLVNPNTSIVELDRIVPVVFFLCIFAGILASSLKKLSPYVLEGIIGLGFLRYSMYPVIELDRGSHTLYTFDNFLRYAVPRALYPMVLGILLLCHRRIGFVREIAAWFTIRRLSVLISGSILLSLLFLMTQSHHPSDIFFTMLPAYHAIHGGTLLVSVMSQYGLLYLAPWMIWLSLFPHAPVSFPVGTFVSVVLLFLYFLALIRVTRALIGRRLLFVITVIASYYFTILVRFTKFSDMVSVVSTPAFTPLRFGMFIFPLWFLLRMHQTGNRRYMKYFIVCSVILFFYSFEIGSVLVVAALFIVLLSVSTQKYPRNSLWQYMGVFIGSLVFCLALITLYTQLSAGVFPDFSMYWYFAKLFGSGFLTTPMRGQTVGLLPFTISLIGLFIGFVRVMKDKKTDGLIMCYLALIELVMLPYYTGRSMNQTLYSISLPFLLLCALLLEHGIAMVRNDRLRFAAWTIVVVCGTVLVMGFARGFVILTRSVVHGAEITENAAIYLYKAFTAWDIRKSGEYLFLSDSMPKGCPLLSFDEKEFELIPALGVPPATQYAFVYGFITTKEQVDALVPHKGASEICIFVSNRFLKKKDDFSYGMYRYFFSTYNGATRKMSEDPNKGFTLYTLPANVFVDK